MDGSHTLPRMTPVPPELRPLVGRIVAELAPSAVWLFGSRARGDHRQDSDWDLLVVLPNDSELSDDPIAGWQLQRGHDVTADVLLARESDVTGTWGVPNTLGYALAREGLRLDVQRPRHR